MEEAVERARRRRDEGTALAHHEEWVLADSQRERAVLLDALGRVLVCKEGDAGSVVWTEAALRRLYGKVDLILHNHPGGSSIGEDDLTTALFVNAREVIAVTPSVRYRLARTDDTWPVGALLSAFAAEQARLVQEMATARDAGRITDAQVQLLFYHVLWQRVVGRFPDQLRYAVEGRRG